MYLYSISIYYIKITIKKRIYLLFVVGMKRALSSSGSDLAPSNKKEKHHHLDPEEEDEMYEDEYEDEYYNEEGGYDEYEDEDDYEIEDEVDTRPLCQYLNSNNMKAFL